MADSRVAHLQLDLDVDADPIAGSVRGVGDEGKRFSGWIELTRNLELRLEMARRDAHPGTDGDVDP